MPGESEQGKGVGEGVKEHCLHVDTSPNLDSLCGAMGIHNRQVNLTVNYGSMHLCQLELHLLRGSTDTLNLITFSAVSPPEACAVMRSVC